MTNQQRIRDLCATLAISDLQTLQLVGYYLNGVMLGFEPDAVYEHIERLAHDFASVPWVLRRRAA